MTGLEIVGASALYLGGLYVAAMIIIGITSILSPRLDSLIAATAICVFGGGLGIIVGLVLLGMQLAG
ncbi:hypothetical protein [Mesorhizobium sp. M8A.F.Ca.ET.021.01.1.1]|uniref:hypothetical protein n=1 Tax=Mesorhizobium sp. M8A.F.Ca.ET.021.01.1.1 TaxID=2496757 RepID=UPI000FC9B579|nr:hypothetical protein [Mesorhizobium sp. M8A.F.Ca.ET.021.01.1.1]RUW57148.1 hypothetical protein EOA36_00765 [Mesorhizobium sp. M8A.F.Ca.ET.021.01.1.1]